MGLDDGSSTFQLWKFNKDSIEVESNVVLQPNNPLFNSAGRWILMLNGSGGGGGGGNPVIIGSGSPEGVVTQPPGIQYWDNDESPDGQAMYLKVTGSGNTGWLLQYQF